MSVSCGTGTPAVESEGAACRLEAVFLCGLHTFVHLWALAHVEPFWSHPTHATKGYVPFVNRPFESQIHGTVNFTQFCCVLLVTWCYRVLLSCYLRPQ